MNICCPWMSKCRCASRLRLGTRLLTYLLTRLRRCRKNLGQTMGQTLLERSKFARLARDFHQRSLESFRTLKINRTSSSRRKREREDDRQNQVQERSMGRDYYAILGVSKGCDDAELKKGESLLGHFECQLPDYAPSTSVSQVGYAPPSRQEPR